MKKIFFCISVIILLHGIVEAQKKVDFHSQNYIGLLEGEAGSAFQLQTINGLSWAGWFAGVGTGLDFYSARTIPVFLSLQKYLKQKPNSLFLSVNGGLNYAWIKKDDNNLNSGVESTYKPGAYGSGYIGYRVGVGKTEAVLLSLGYSFKRIHEIRKSPTFCINPPCAMTVEYYDSRLRTLSILLGFQF